MHRSRCLRLALGLALGLALVGTSSSAAVAAPDVFPDEIDLPDGWAPEGITGGNGTTLFVGSLEGGAIWRADARTGTGAVLVPGVAGQVAVGVEHDADAGRLWVAGGPTGAVRVYDAHTGALLEAYQFEAGFLNDLVVTDDAVYVTDSMIQQLAVIPLGDNGTLPSPADVTTLPLSGDITFVAGEFNANGIVAKAGSLILVNSFTGELFRVDPATGVADSIDLGGGSVTFGDGLERRGNTLFVVRNQLNLIDVYRLDGRIDSAVLLGTLTSTGFDFPTTAAVAAGRVWAVNARFTTPVTPTTEYSITQISARP